MPHSRDDYGDVLEYIYVASGGRLVCTGESFGSYNYAPIDEVYPPDEPTLPVKKPWGSIDYVPNPNYRSKRS